MDLKEGTNGIPSLVEILGTGDRRTRGNLSRQVTQPDQRHHQMEAVGRDSAKTLHVLAHISRARRQARLAHSGMLLFGRGVLIQRLQVLAVEAGTDSGHGDVMASSHRVAFSSASP